MFLGCTMISGIHSFSETAIPSLNSDVLSARNAVFDELCVTTIPVTEFDGSIPQVWGFDTALHAHFHGNLQGGNVNFTEKIVNSVRIKKRTKKDTHFQTIFEKEIKKKEDFSIEIFDYFEPLGTVEYAYVPVISGGESHYIIGSVDSSFDSYFIAERGTSFPLILNNNLTETVNYQSNSVKPMGRKFPITIVNGNTGYRSGKIDCMFVEIKENGEIDVLQSNEYRETVYQFLTNGNPKILKDYDGNLRMVNIDGDITESNRSVFFFDSNSFSHVESTFNWVECGDAYNAKELYDNHFIDTNLG